MSSEPQLLPPDPPLQAVRPELPAKTKHIPNFGHLMLFLVITGIAMLVTQLAAVALARSLHLFPHEALTELARDPRLILPTMFLSYLVAGLMSMVIFSNMWRRTFASGVRWDLAPVVRHRWLLILTGAILSIVVQTLSNFLPMPKQLPIDEFFRTSLDVWLVAFFGVFIAPVFEELAFRGFLLPALANTWDTVRHRSKPSPILDRAAFESLIPSQVVAPPLDSFVPAQDPKWSTGALVFASVLTSIFFAFLHADQLAHAYAPLVVLFLVSLVLCAVRLRWHSLAASALVHACYNGTIFIMLFVATSGFRHLEKLKQ